MANDSKIGIDAKVKIGDENVVGVGTWSITGSSYAEIEDTEFGDDDFAALRGLRTGGTVTFGGNFKVDDTTGQDAIKDAFWNKTDLTTLRFYVDNTSYYAPNDTTGAGGGLPADVMVSHIKILKEPDISFDKSGLGTISFEGKVFGAMRLN